MLLRGGAVAALVAMVGGFLVGCSGRGAAVEEPDWLVAMTNASAPRDDLFGGFRCAGVEIAPQRVMSVAHCLDDVKPSGLAVTVGVSNLCRGVPVRGTRRTVQRIVRAPGTDVVVLVLNAPVPELPVSVPNTARASGDVLAYGWSRKRRDSPMPCLPTMKRWRLIANAACDRVASAGPSWARRSELCASPIGGSDAGCSGDSGGPVVLGDLPHRLVGVVSWSTACDRSGMTLVSVSSWGR